MFSTDIDQGFCISWFHQFYCTRGLPDIQSVLVWMPDIRPDRIINMFCLAKYLVRTYLNTLPAFNLTSEGVGGGWG